MAGKSFVFRFGDVEVREREFSILKAGEVLPVEPKAFRVLLHLLRSPQKLIPKEELLNAVWGETAVSENSLTRSIALLRRLLGDEARTPRYIETVATVGYRLVCPVEVSGAASDNDEEIPRPIAAAAPFQHKLTTKRPMWWGVGVIALVIGIVGFALIRRWYFPTAPVIDGIFQLTDDGNPKFLSNLVSDGSRIYFNEMQGGSPVVAQVAATGGQTGQIPTKTQAWELAALTTDSAGLVIHSDNFVDPCLWILPLPAGESRRLPVAARGAGAAFTADGHLVFTRDRSLYVAEGDGSNPRRLSEFPAFVEGPVVSPDGKRIRLTVIPSRFIGSIWEVNADGTSAHRLLQDWQGGADVCCGRWTPDGRYFVFQRRSQGQTDLWALPEATRLLGGPSSPIRLTNGPLSYHLPFPSPDGKHIYTLGSKQRGELVRYDRASKEFVPYLSGISAMDATLSRDGKWVAYMSYPGRDLWRSRVDGSDRLQLTYPPTTVFFPRISPDGTKVAYGAVDENGVVCAYVVSMQGGPPRKIADKARSGASWSPDSNSLNVIATDKSGVGLTFFGLETVDLRTGKTYSVPDSANTGGAFWPQPNMLVAPRFTNGYVRFSTFDFKTQKWSDLEKGPLLNLAHWMQSVDGTYLYYSTEGDDPEIRRIALTSGKVEVVASLKNFRAARNDDFGDWLGVAPDGSPLLTRDIGTQEIYDLNVRWH